MYTVIVRGHNTDSEDTDDRFFFDFISLAFGKMQIFLNLKSLTLDTCLIWVKDMEVG